MYLLTLLGKIKPTRSHRTLSLWSDTEPMTAFTGLAIIDNSGLGQESVKNSSLNDRVEHT